MLQIKAQINTPKIFLNITNLFFTNLHMNIMLLFIQKCAIQSGDVQYKKWTKVYRAAEGTSV